MMADTSYIKKSIEPYIQRWLSTIYPGHKFLERHVVLTTGHSHKFDAVSEDTSIVAAALCNRAKTKTGNDNTGGIRKASEDVALLNLLPTGITRIMVFTDASFRDLVTKRAKRLGISQIEMLVCPLPRPMRSRLIKVLDEASLEQRGRLVIEPLRR